MAKTIKLRRSLGFQNPRDEQLNNGKGEEPKKRRSNEGEEPKTKRSRIPTKKDCFESSSESNGNESVVRRGGKQLMGRNELTDTDDKEDDTDDEEVGTFGGGNETLVLHLGGKKLLLPTKAANMMRNETDDK